MTSGLLLLALMSPPQASAPGAPDPGISATLAEERASAIGSLRYKLSLSIPGARSEPILGRAVVRVVLREPHRLVFDFASARDRVKSLTLAGRRVPFTVSEDHFVVAADETVAGENEIAIDFVAGDAPLNRNDEFLYSLFVPARAHLAIPCFDQPDIKGRYTLALEIPADWVAVANGAEVERRVLGDRVALTFAETKPLPTYLVGFVSGRFTVETAERDGRRFRMFHRETDPAKLAHNRDRIFTLHARALTWLEDYTDIPYPFGKFDFVLVPSFQFGGMEHPGAILYNAGSTMLEPTATQDQLLQRASLVAHETSHMWFGDLVTMRWFDDVWMKEVFANFLASKIVSPSYPEVNHDLRFLLAHYPAAYDVDRTAGANPIRQRLDNLTDAGSLYGAIVYQKAPVVMRQLEMIIGAVDLRDGLREYLQKYAFGNASWSDLISLLDGKTDEDLVAWSHAWVEERGRPRLSTVRTLDADGTIGRLEVVQDDPAGRGRVWPQRVIVTVADGTTTARVPLFLRERVTPVPGVRGLDGSSYVLVSGAGLAYGAVELDEPSRTALLSVIPQIDDPLERGAAWLTLWDNVLDGHVQPSTFVDALVRALPLETDDQNINRMLQYLVRAFWKFLPPHERSVRGAVFETLLRRGLERAVTASQKSTWFAALRDMTISNEGVRFLSRVWRHDERVPGLMLAETDEMTLAMELALRDADEALVILARQLDRIRDPDRHARFSFVMPALSPDSAVREQAFAAFSSLENRGREAWVLEAQRYLNHPLREAHAIRFVSPSLELVDEISRTGDIFFPRRWLDATLSGHRSREAVALVDGYLASHPGLSERLRWAVLAASDDLVRAAGQPEP
jgi:aminopeptidase N